MTLSMTGFAALRGAGAGFTWAWELRSVNGKGLDLRLRVPDWIEGLEQALRGLLAKSLARGNVSLSLRLQRDETAGALALNMPALSGALDALARIEAEAESRGMVLAQTSPAQILTLRGVYEQASDADASKALYPLLMAEAETLLADFLAMRAREGAALADVLTRQLAEVSDLTTRAAKAAEDRRPEVARALREAMARLLENADNLDEGRIAQELALLAVKSDVTEEIDRLHAHTKAAADLIAAQGPVGRKFDFLMQEFNREANTLCSKAGSAPLSALGLELKTVIDQMREQVQNVE